MTAEDVAEPPAQPNHPLPALTTFELRDYRRRLEHALETLPATSRSARCSSSGSPKSLPSSNPGPGSARPTAHDPPVPLTAPPRPRAPRIDTIFLELRGQATAPYARF
jgi:hypothetical protein